MAFPTTFQCHPMLSFSFVCHFLDNWINSFPPSTHTHTHTHTQWKTTYRDYYRVKNVSDSPLLWLLTDVINEKWSKFASILLSGISKSCTTFPGSNKLWWGKWGAECKKRRRYIFQDPRYFSAGCIWSSKSDHTLKSTKSHIPNDEHHRFRNLICIGTINSKPLWTLQSLDIFQGNITLKLNKPIMNFEWPHYHSMCRNFSGKTD